MTSTTPASPAIPTITVSSAGAATHIDLNFAAAMATGSGSIFLTDGAVQTVIDRATGQPKLRVVGGTFSKEITLDKLGISGTHVSFDATGLPPGAKLNLYMAAGTLVSGGKAVPAITVPEKLSFNVPGTVPPPPGLSATITVEDRVLKAGADIKVTVTFSKALESLDEAAISADHASIKNIAHSTDNRTWTITLSAADSIESATNALRLDMSKVSSADGTSGSGVLTSGNYLVDTVVDAYLLDIVEVNDGGPSSTDGITNISGASGDNPQFVKGTLRGGLASDEYIELVINDVTVDKSRIQITADGDYIEWSYNLGGDADPPLVFDRTENEITARVVKLDGHYSTAVGKTIILDTTQPKVLTSPHESTNVPLDANLVVTFDEAVFWHHEESDADMLYLYGSDESIIEIYLDETNFSEGGKKLTISAAEHNMKAGIDYSLVLPENLTDLAGNHVFGYEIDFRTAEGGSEPDTTDPHATRVVVEGDGFYKAGDVITFRVQFDEYVKVITEAIPSITLSNNKKASYAGNLGDELVFKYTVAAGDDSSSLKIKDIAELGGTVEDLAGNALDLLASAHIVLGGIYDDSGYGYMIDVKVDTIAPTAPDAPVLDALASDSGALGDGITDDNTPTLNGTAEASAEIAIYNGSTLLGTTKANADGVWTKTLGTPVALADGSYTITVKQTDRAGNTSTASSPLTLVIDTATPAALTTVVLATDTGISSSDGITRENYAALRGSGAEPGASIKIMLGDAVVGIGSSDANGDWIANFASPLNEGVHTYKVRQIDAAGHASADSAPISFTVDRTGPTSAPPAPQLATASDTGASSTDGLTSDNTPTFTGTGAIINSEIVLYADEAEIGRTVSDASGNWSITVGAAKALHDGTHSIAVQQLDVAGNKSPYSTSVTLRVDTDADEPDRPELAASSDTGSSSSDGITSDTTPTFKGTGAENGATVVLYAGTRVIGSTVADSAGHWDLTVLDADKFTIDGSYAITAKQTDKAGNVSEASNPFTLVIDTTGPTVSSFVNKSSTREAQLGFSEQIVFKPTGMFKLFQAATEFLTFSGSSGSGSNWYVTDGSGGHDSVLNFKVSVSGLYNLQMNNESIQDLAGNVAIIGSPQWVVDLPPPA
ncbi:Ig-like domain-containing protein [Massilia sp. IC2-476]|uniref:Ig-like domain-containing protein n=1 Tax=Massilia sp. IC2-476 TaxID=2887199 RepID=UPI001D0F5C53|nr:Ig-like domain-containing protein [Massilia sp. IC2-476]MCC2971279.1 Ig-like domain-containing protein [Massilia sp. IC2-476]